MSASQKKASGNFIRCRFCNWKTVKWKGKRGPHTAFVKLRAHINDAHWEEREGMLGDREDFAEDIGMPLEIER